MKKGDVKRTQILDTAEKLFFERGYDRTSVQDILDELHLSKGGFYHYFDAKDSVLRAVSERRAQDRFDRLSADLYGAQRGPVERLDMILGMANLFEWEEPAFAALMLKLCYIEKDATMLAHRRRVLINRLLPYANYVISEGLAQGSLHTRHPRQLGRLLLMMACDVDDEACGILAAEPDNPEAPLKVLELLNAWREAAEQISGAPYGSITLFDAPHLINACQAAREILMEQGGGEI